MTTLNNLVGQGLRGLANWFQQEEAQPAVAAEQPAPMNVDAAEADGHASQPQPAVKEAAPERPAVAPRVDGAESLEDVQKRVAEMRDHYENVVKPQVADVEKDYKGRTEHEQVMKRNLMQGILSLRDQIEKVQENAQAKVREADRLKNDVTAIDAQLNLITQIRSRLINESNARGEVDLTNDRISKQLFENASNLKILPPQMGENLGKLSKERRDTLMTHLKDKSDEIKRKRDDINTSIQKLTKEAYKLVETYNECWKMMKKLIDDYFSILRKISQAMGGR